ncbi:hypothetical protein C5946_12115 [Cronobacter sakazakii]|nr:hypothetical protein C3D65_03595 [Cronobacter sakazakii]PPY47148.1 hypothetical protein C3D64_14375 [Cronobacter sakazakii]PQY06018.1 hypothetical protein C5956_17130 [Cronobacter sakazakii]PQY28067.1 hypothetical protein C5946_12115 [Cronobacter sakazakii]
MVRTERPLSGIRGHVWSLRHKCISGNTKPQTTKNPSTLNQDGGVDGLHKMGTSKKSSGTN